MTTSVSYDEVYKTRWLKSDDLPDEDLVLTIRDVIDEEVGDEKEIKFILIFSEIQKQLILNKTNARILSDRFGKNPSAMAQQTYWALCDRSPIWWKNHPCNSDTAQRT